MTNRRLYVVHGLGGDGVGLVRSLDLPIAEAGGNIVDIRQDVLHGLFTFVAVVDLSETELRLEGLREMVGRIAEDTGLRLTVDNYVPRPRDPQRHNILLILVGRDAPGIIAQTADLLSRYRINIEFSHTVARQGVFLMELLCDMSRCAIPQELLMVDLKDAMQQRDIQALFQSKDVFNKRKRVVLFDIQGSFFEPEASRELIRHASLDTDELRTLFLCPDPAERLRSAARRLEGLGTNVLDSVLRTLLPTDGTVELLHTLKVLGYRIALLSRGFSFFTDAMRNVMGLDYAFGVPLRVDEDRRTVLGQVTDEDLLAIERSRVITELSVREKVDIADITVISDGSGDSPPGIRVDFDLATILSHHKRHILSRDAVMGLLGACGTLRPSVLLKEPAS